uniref:RAP domain-containing protein n=1 Tax=Tetradesmus obliquus TaxID=3088 RepID=A0A383VS61_TETOB|eukprot:jgi/Sobl393_1/1961/SZX67602.1
MQHTSEQQHTKFQRSVFAAVKHLPIAWQQQPQMEQPSVGRDGVTPDGALLLEVFGKTAAGVLVAVEADGPTHFREPDGGLKGPTKYRNRALAVRGYRLISVSYRDWAKLQGDEQRQQQHLLRLFKEAGVV